MGYLAQYTHLTTTKFSKSVLNWMSEWYLVIGGVSHLEFLFHQGNAVEKDGLSLPLALTMS